MVKTYKNHDSEAGHCLFSKRRKLTKSINE